MKENHFLDDGAYSAVQVIIEMVRQALAGRSKDIGAAILADLPEPLESREYRLKVIFEMCLGKMRRLQRMCSAMQQCLSRESQHNSGRPVLCRAQLASALLLCITLASASDALVHDLRACTDVLVTWSGVRQRRCLCRHGEDTAVLQGLAGRWGWRSQRLDSGGRKSRGLARGS